MTSTSNQEVRGLDLGRNMRPEETMYQRWCVISEYWNEILYPVPRILRNTLCNPRHGPNLLLLEPNITVENGIVELLQECLLIQMDLLDKEPVFEFTYRLGFISTKGEFVQEVGCAFGALSVFPSYSPPDPIL